MSVLNDPSHDLSLGGLRRADLWGDGYPSRTSLTGKRRLSGSDLSLTTQTFYLLHLLAVDIHGKARRLLVPLLGNRPWDGGEGMPGHGWSIRPL